MKLAVYQPVVPSYRVPFFNKLACVPGIDLSVYASKTFPDSPATSDAPFNFAYEEHQVSSGFRNRVFWQHGLYVPRHFGPGDAIVISGNVRMLSNLPLMLEAKRRGVALVWWTHGWSTGTTRASLWVRRRFMNFADTVLLYTDREVERFKRTW
jgi:hypothetical protein